MVVFKEYGENKKLATSLVKGIILNKLQFHFFMENKFYIYVKNMFFCYSIKYIWTLLDLTSMLFNKLMKNIYHFK